jgi:toxin ParE1/3/4
MYTIIVSPEARADLTSYYDTIAQANQPAALSLFDAARQTFADLARFPRSGSLSPYHPDPTQEIRRWAVKGFRKYLIFYRVSTESIEIIRILHGAQDIDRLFNTDRPSSP